MSLSDIEWTDYVWNPCRGCSMAPGSELGGCLYCWAARMAARNLPAMRSPTTGNPFAIFTDNGPRWKGPVELIESKLFEPLQWRKSQRVFVNSMSDLFHESLPYPDILHVFQVMAKCQRQTFQILTKRQGRMRELLSLCWWRNLGHSPEMGGDVWVKVIAGEQRAGDQNFLPNVWLGVSIENPPTADQRIPELLMTPAAIRFVSYEPALAEVDWRKFLPRRMALSEIPGSALNDGCTEMWTEGIDWAIIGGESGPHARPFSLKWLRNTIQQFKSAGVPLFVKQLGDHPVSDNEADLPQLVHISGKGGDMEQWPPDVRVRQFPANHFANQSSRLLK